MTRIIAGIHKGRRLSVPKGRDIRPTTDRMRERLFSMLMHSRYPDLGGARVLDLFAGTGALGLEALSRGAKTVTFVEKAPASLQVLKENISALNVQDQTSLLAKSATLLPPADHPCDVVFMDPPYRQNLVEPALQSILSGNWLAAGGVIVCELATDDESAIPSALEIVDERSQGQQRILFLMTI